MKKLAIGVDDFKRLRESNAYFVDKSLFIETVFDDASDVLLFPRPRRFGKTLNMSMLHYFCTNKNSAENRHLFDGLAIAQSPVFEQHFGQYPVISLSLKEIKSQSANGFYLKIRQLLSSLFDNHKYLIESNAISEFDKEIFQNIKSGKAEIEYYEGSLKLLTKLLNIYYNRKAIILLDEYDTPVHEAYLNGYYQQTVDFLRVFLGSALKGNEHLQKGILTGILRVSKESMFSDLNNVKVYSVLSEKFNAYFGFTQVEVDHLLDNLNLTNSRNQVKAWYNGYYFGNEEIYNPWSILCFADTQGKFKPYWLSTSANALVHTLIKDADNSVKKTIEDVLNKIPVYTSVNENISFEDLQNSDDTIMSFLIQTGYLKALYNGMKDSRMMYDVSIPNQELRLIYIDTINKWFNESIGNKDLDTMLNALIANDINTFERILSKFVLETLSYFNVGRKTKEVERVFQAFLLGMLISLKDRYEVYSEKESGYGRFDVSVIPKDKSQQAIIMELKSIDTFNNESKDQTLESALRQIDDRHYETTLRQQGCTRIMKIAITFDGKRVWAKTKF